ncbi:hypothetical protein C0992_009994 [Termitomyces sp. T32_za158]|nr:hypothetical protein C0992_009994 [Termitomyces sp. T32_za158]
MRITPFLRQNAQSISAALRERVRRPALLNRLANAEDLVPLFKDDDYIGWSGFTGVGYPKAMPTAIADYAEANNLQANPETKKKFNLFVGASVGPEVEDRWARLDMIARRYPHQVGKDIAKGINAGRIEFADKHLSSLYYLLIWHLVVFVNLTLHPRVVFPQDLTYGYYSLRKKHGDPRKHLDWAIVEATCITEDGKIVPGASVGATPEILQSAEKIIVEVNTLIPNLEGLHDINQSFVPPYRQPYLIKHVKDRIGEPAIAVDPDRIVAILESRHPDNTGPNAPENDESRAIAGHLIEFLSEEVAAGRLPKNLLPLQSGIGNVANSIIGGLADGPFEQVQVWTEVLQDTFIPFFDSGKLSFATATSIKFSPEGFEHFYANWANYKNRLLLRSQQVANSPEIIRRLGIIAMNTPLEVDIHDLDIVVTEQGLADLRGLSPRERAPLIIEKCAHPDYKDSLREYYDRSLHECLKRGAGHEPHMLRNAFKFHTNFMEHGTMKIKNWD